MRFRIGLIVACIVTHTALAAQTAGSSATAEETARIQEETARLTALKARSDAENALITSRLGPFGNTGVTGTTTLGDKAGQLEAAILGAAAIDQAADDVATELTGISVNENGDPQPSNVPAPLAAGDSVILLTADQPLNLALPALIRVQAHAVAEQARQAWIDAGCAALTPPPDPTEATGVPAIATAALGLLRTDTTVRGLEIQLKDRVFLTAVARELVERSVTVTLPTSIRVPRSGQAASESELMGSVNGAYMARRNAEDCRRALAANAATAQAKATEIARLAATVARFDSLFTSITTASATGEVPLAEALLQEQLGRASHILRLSIDMGGGTLLNRRNLWTILGAESILITGGMVGTYELTRTATGEFESAGLVVCRTRLSGMRQIHRRSPRAICEANVASLPPGG